MEEIVLDFGGVVYYIDFDNLVNLIEYKEKDGVSSKTAIETEEKIIKRNDDSEEVIKSKREYPKTKELDLSRYETYRTLFEVLLTPMEEIDGSLGAERGLQETSLPFKIAFNTLVKYGVLKQL